MLNEFKEKVNKKCGLVLQVEKSEVYSASGEMPSEAPAGFVKAGVMVDDEFQPGFLCYGVPIGTDKYVSTMLDLQLDEMEGEIHKMQEVLEPSRQSMWALLRSSICQDWTSGLQWYTQVKWRSVLKEWTI